VAVRSQNRQQATFDRLMQRVRTSGKARVIVGVAAAFTPEGAFPSQTLVAAQRDSISQAQNRVVGLVPQSLRQSIRRFASIPYMALEADAATLESLRRSPTVAAIEEDVPVPTALTESVPIVGVPTVWPQRATGVGWAIAVLDTGVDKTHPFLVGKVVSEACYSSDVAGTSATLCPGGVTSSTSPGSGVNCPYPGCEHGTHVAGIAAGTGSTFSGVAKDASIVAIQVFSSFPASGSVLAWTSDIIKGLERVYALKDIMNIAAVNMSLGGGRFFTAADCDAFNSATKAAIDQLRSVNIPTIIASGNNGYFDSISSPGCISSAISVGSTDDGSLGTVADAVSSFSNSVSFLSLLAPGRWIDSSIPGGAFANFSGTSMATPHVAGAWAALRSAVAGPLSVSQVLSVLQASGTPITDSRNGIVKSRIRVDRALNLLTWGASISRTPSVMTPGDYDGDGKADVTVYRSTTGTWYSIQSSNSMLLSVGWGDPFLLDRPVPADYDGDGKTDFAVYRQTTGTWYVIRSSNSTLLSATLGDPAAGDLPVPGDYDGDGKADFAVYRTTTGQWSIVRSSNSTLLSVGWGDSASGDTPVPGDYDGDGKTDIAVYRTTTGGWYIIRSSNSTLFSVGWGDPPSGDTPVPGDYDGDGKTDIAVYRTATGGWYIIRSSNSTMLSVGWGAPGLRDIPVAADYDGDNRTDVGVYRYSTGVWYVIRSSNSTLLSVGWGAPTLGDAVREY
jgi:hypothetical protein